MDLRARLAAEALGTTFLVATVVGSGLMVEGLTDDPALALLCTTLATGAMLAVLIAVLGPISGAHLNPALTMVLALTRGIAFREAALYVSVQIAGGIAGTFLAHLMFAAPMLQFATTARTGASQWLSEAVAVFGLVSVILAGLRFNRAALPWLVGLYIAAAYWFTASTSFANPAVTLARMLTDSFSGIRPADAPAFIAAQLAGAIAAAALIRGLPAAAGDRAVHGPAPRPPS